MNRRSSRPTAAKRRLIWARFSSGPTAVVAGTAFNAFPLDTFETAYGAQLLGCTIMRVRGIIAAKQTSLVSDGTLVCAMKVADLPGVTTEAPVTSGVNDDWFMYEAWASVTNVPTASEPSYQLQKEIDVRARRRLDELGQRLVFAAEVRGPGAAQFRINVHLSILVALP